MPENASPHLVRLLGAFVAVAVGMGLISAGLLMPLAGASGCAARGTVNAFDNLDGEDREIVIRAFVEGATLTEKGAPTYFYNITRKARRTRGLAKEHQQRANKKGKKPEADNPVE